MGPIYGQESGFVIDHSKFPGKGHRTTTAISTKALGSIRIAENHFKIKIRMILQQYQTIRANAKFAMTQIGYNLAILLNK
jgi:hypothetical protein